MERGSEGEEEEGRERERAVHFLFVLKNERFPCSRSEER